MTSTKVKSAASLMMETAALSAQSIPDPIADVDFSQVMDRTAKDVLEITPASGSQLQDLSSKAPAPLKVDKSSTANVIRKNMQSQPNADQANAANTESKTIGDVTQSAIEQQAQQNVNEAVENIRDTKEETTANIVSDENPQETVISEEVMEVIAAAVNSVIDSVAEALDLSPEELISSMEALGMKETDLFDPAKLKLLMVEVAGEGDALNIVMDEKLFDAVDDMTKESGNAAAALMEELDLSGNDELKGLLDAFNAQNESNSEVQVSDQNIIVAEITPDENNTIVFPEDQKVMVPDELQNADNGLSVREDVQLETNAVNNLTQADPDHIMEDPQQNVSLTDSRTQHSETQPAVNEVIASVNERVIAEEETRSAEDTTGLTGAVADEGMVIPEGETKAEGGESKGSEQKQSSSKDPLPEASKEDAAAQAARSSEASQGMRNFADAVRADIQAPVQQAPVPTQTVDAYDILQQINQNLRADLAREVTEIHMKLNPETLGNLLIHVTAKEGVITAQFIAENEAVKNALSSQVVELRENLQEQGLKVEAVEVAIAGQELNRSYQQNGEGQGRFEEPKKNKVHKIQLSGNDTLEDIAGMDLDDEDRLTAEMMAINGNSVDYRA